MAELRSVHPRPEITVTELPAPHRLAPHAYALGAGVHGRDGDDGATGRLVLLHDPAGQEAWRGTLRLVSYVSAGLEPELAADPLLPEVGWSWLTEALTTHARGFTALAGTVTQTTSTRFGELTGEPPTADLEIRASWTPVGPGLDTHLTAWCAVLATAAGLPPPGVRVLPGR